MPGSIAASRESWRRRGAASGPWNRKHASRVASAPTRDAQYWRATFDIPPEVPNANTSFRTAHGLYCGRAGLYRTRLRTEGAWQAFALGIRPVHHESDAGLESPWSRDRRREERLDRSPERVRDANDGHDAACR